MERYQTKPFALLGVNLDDDPALVRNLQTKGTVTWPSFTRGAEMIAATYGVRSIPFVVVIDHQGIVQRIFTGPPNLAELDRLLDDLIKRAEDAG